MPNRTDVQNKVTDSIIAALESGVVPWQKPWVTRGAPANLVSGHVYRGINWLILQSVADECGYGSNRWLTYKQAQSIGGQVRKGEQGTAIVFWKMIERGDDTIPLLRYYTVFNSEQVDGITQPQHATTDVDVDTIASVRDYVLGVWTDTGNSLPTFRIEGDQPAYLPNSDAIKMPRDEQFRTVEGYTGALLHEAAHSTGHQSRLNRWEGQSHQFGCADYAAEELTAEIAAAMIAARMGLTTEMDQHAAYVKSWLERLRDDRSMLIGAAQRAQKAADWICGELSVSALVGVDANA